MMSLSPITRTEQTRDIETEKGGEEEREAKVNQIKEDGKMSLWLCLVIRFNVLAKPVLAPFSIPIKT